MMSVPQPPCPLTSAGACDWLRSVLADPANEECDMDELMDQIVSGEWISQDEILSFLKEVSIQLAQTACKDPNTETAHLFGRPIYYGLSLGSPYYQLWEKGFLTRSPALQEAVSTEDWDVDIDSGITEINLICLIPLATAYELPLFEQLRNRSVSELNEPREEFLGYVAAMLTPGYYEGTLPVEILNVPSSRVASEILEDWTQYRDLWQPDIIESFLETEFADSRSKQLIARVLQGEDDIDSDSWDEHRDEYWEDDQIERVLTLCS
jgi:hypothetical protein